MESHDGEVDPLRRALGGLALIAGGVLWIWAALALAAKPYGDSAIVRLLRPTEPLSATYRVGDDLVTAFVLALAVIVTLAGLGVLYGRAAWTSGRSGRAAVALLAMGLAIALYPAARPLIGDEFPLFVLGFVGWTFGMIALAIAALRHQVLPRSAAYMLIVAAAVQLVLSNFQDDRVLFLSGQAAVWIWLGLRALMPRPAAAPAY